MCAKLNKRQSRLGIYATDIITMTLGALEKGTIMGVNTQSDSLLQDKQFRGVLSKLCS